MCDQFNRYRFGHIYQNIWIICRWLEDYFKKLDGEVSIYKINFINIFDFFMIVYGYSQSYLGMVEKDI